MDIQINVLGYSLTSVDEAGLLSFIPQMEYCT